jgi:hypothetical protein
MKDVNPKSGGGNGSEKWRLGLVVLVVAALLLGGWQYFKQSPIISSGLASCLGFDSEEWTVLHRPNTLWRPGIAMRFPDGGGAPILIGNYLQQCLSVTNIAKIIGTGSATSCDSGISFDVSLSTALRVDDGQLANMSLAAGGDGTGFTSIVNIAAAKEVYIDQFELENFLTQERYDQMPLGCQSIVTDPKRFLISGIYQIEAGSIEVKTKNGMKVDLSLPDNRALKDAVLTGGFNVTANGLIQISADGPPLTVAVLSSDMTTLASSVGVERRGMQDFKNEMAAAGETAE